MAFHGTPWTELYRLAYRRGMTLHVPAQPTAPGCGEGDDDMFKGLRDAFEIYEDDQRWYGKWRSIPPGHTAELAAQSVRPDLLVHYLRIALVRATFGDRPW